MKKILFYDCEISKCVPPKYGYLDERYEYCGGWEDKQNMGIACICVYATWLGYRVFLSESDQLDEFRSLASQADEIVGFNSLDFDDRLLAANGVNIRTTYDLLCEVRIASGQPPHYTLGVTRGGYNLNGVARANLGRGKTGTGELAPKLWQDGKTKEVIRYCFNDIDLLRELYDLRSHFIDPTNDKLLFLRGGDRLAYTKAVWKLKLSSMKRAAQKFLNRLQLLLWVIPRFAHTEYQIDFCFPFTISLRMPKINVWVSYEAVKKYNSITTSKVEYVEQDDDEIPF